jgi:hypothetical protein
MQEKIKTLQKDNRTMEERLQTLEALVNAQEKGSEDKSQKDFDLQSKIFGAMMKAEITSEESQIRPLIDQLVQLAISNAKNKPGNDGSEN